MTRGAFGRPVEADLLAALRKHAGRIPELSLVAVDVLPEGEFRHVAPFSPL